MPFDEIMARRSKPIGRYNALGLKCQTSISFGHFQPTMAGIKRIAITGVAV
jgi:hypothetical protein